MIFFRIIAKIIKFGKTGKNDGIEASTLHDQIFRMNFEPSFPAYAYFENFCVQATSEFV